MKILFGAAGVHDWWNEDCVPEKIKRSTEERIQREFDSGVTPRSEDPIDYTNFGELGEIIRHNWDIFGGTLRSQKAVTKVLIRIEHSPSSNCALQHVG